MDLIKYQVLLPNKFWNLAKSKDELKRMVEQYLSVGYPQYEIQKIIKNGQAHLAICIRR